MSFNEPQVEAKFPKERSPEYVKTLAEIEHVLKQSEDEQKAYITKRLDVLMQDTEAGEVSLVGRSVHKGFLGPTTEVRRTMMVDPFVVDDPDLYEDLFKTIKMFKSAEGWKGKSLREIMPMSVQWTLSNYFGNSIAGSTTEMKNREFYLDHTTADSSALSLKEFKGKGFAVCAEKGAAAQNLLAFVGMESELIAASDCRIPAEAEEEAHYYILIHGPKGDMIYDPTNPRLLLNKEGILTSYSPAMYSITSDQSQRLMLGESITVEHVDETISEAGEKNVDTSSRIYTGPKKIGIH